MQHGIAWWLVSLAVALGLAGQSAPAQTRPNVILILADDMGWSDLGWQAWAARCGVKQR